MQGAKPFARREAIAARSDALRGHPLRQQAHLPWREGVGVEDRPGRQLADPVWHLGPQQGLCSPDRAR